jgi:hypothetical protein
MSADSNFDSVIPTILRVSRDALRYNEPHTGLCITAHIGLSTLLAGPFEAPSYRLE